MAKSKEDVVVVFDEDRSIVENGESWVYADSLNIAKVLDQKHSKILERIRKVLDDYGIQDKDEDYLLKRASSEGVSGTASREFVNRNTDFTRFWAESPLLQGWDG